MKIFKTRNVYFVFPLRIFVSAHVLITYIMAPGMFTNLCLILLLLLAGSLQFRNFTFNYQKAKKEVPEKLEHSTIGRWRDSFSSALCSILSYSTLFQPITARVISELYYKTEQSTFKASPFVKWWTRSDQSRRAHFSGHFMIASYTMISLAIWGH